jgi:uncharacterized phage protein (TIGR01671 family)
MKRIKFRVWEPLNKKMYFPKFALYELRESGTQSREMGLIVPINDVCYKAYQVMNLDSVEVMQWVGYQDKFGTDIYEGDIVLTDESAWKGFVVNSRDSFYCKDEVGGFASFCNWEEYQVLGNIYQYDLKGNVVTEKTNEQETKRE